MIRYSIVLCHHQTLHLINRYFIHALCIPSLVSSNFLAELCMGIHFSPLQAFLPELLLDPFYQRAREVVIQSHMSERGTCFNLCGIILV